MHNIPYRHEFTPSVHIRYHGNYEVTITIQIEPRYTTCIVTRSVCDAEESSYSSSMHYGIDIFKFISILSIVDSKQS